MQNELHSKEDQTCHSSQEENMEDLNEWTGILCENKINEITSNSYWW